MANISEKLFTILYADDSNLFITGKDIDALISTLNDEMPKFIQWLNVIKLCLNIDKTQYMVFSLRKPIVSNLDVIISDQKIKQSQCVKFLGVLIDYRLSWRDHINNVKNKISKGIGIISKTRKYFDSDTLLTLYYSFVYPYLTYCAEVWGNASYINYKKSYSNYCICSS